MMPEPVKVIPGAFKGTVSKVNSTSIARRPKGRRSNLKQIQLLYFFNNRFIFIERDCFAALAAMTAFKTVSLRAVKLKAMSSYLLRQF